MYGKFSSLSRSFQKQQIRLLLLFSFYALYHFMIQLIIVF